MSAERVALVTGANTGIGRAIAERFVRDGYALAYVTHTRDDESRAVYETLAAQGRVHWVSGDLADADVPERLVRETLDALGRIDVLVNNAGLSTSGPALELTREDFDVTFAVDVRAPFLLTQHAARAMPEGGVIVNITSIHELRARAGFVVYAAAKAALAMLTKGFALELADRGIRVVGVAPGAIATERNAEAAGLGPAIPLGRPGTAEEVANAVAWVCSGEASYLTGTTVLLDGGAALGVFPGRV